MRSFNFLMATGLTIPLLASAGNPRFWPDTSGIQYERHLAPLPSLYNLSDSQSLYTNIANSFWSTSFVLGSDGHEYLVISHVLGGNILNIYRASVLDITDPSYFKQYSSFYNTTSGRTELDFSFDGYYFGLVGKDRLGSIRTYSTYGDVHFNISFELSSPIILNGGVGSFQWEVSSVYDTVVKEWSMPAGRTIGSLRKGDKIVEFDSDKSFTWYDRQWQVGSATNWTWFQLHLQSGSEGTSYPEKYSIWFFPSGFDDSTKGFATVREQSGVQTVKPASLSERGDPWLSPISNIKYALNWKIELVDGTVLEIASIRDDQELSDPQGSFKTYEGFVNVTGATKSGERMRGFGLVEIQPPQSV
ncbi:hypothetical protein BS50DRAFT_566738 [Corynespora cassiicola Philippines]|uniref:AttH domain-containing protein n=1 Tax=Corynespora cassiicola Philippines TaxID=1448308 RepID=A0A2T2P818_CORCC|nr:hypothetical protein BS50DRAFT_566738 [Corynespora cassiicola Philippines]